MNLILVLSIKNGFYTVIIENPAVEDIGLDRTIIDPQEMAKTKKTNAPKD